MPTILPIRVAVGSFLAVLAMLIYCAGMVILSVDEPPTYIWLVVGLLKGILLPLGVLYGEYLAVIKQDKAFAAIVGFGWVFVAAAFTHCVFSEVEPDFVFVVICVLMCAIPWYIAYSHLYLWRTLAKSVVHPAGTQPAN